MLSQSVQQIFHLAMMYIHNGSLFKGFVILSIYPYSKSTRSDRRSWLVVPIWIWAYLSIVVILPGPIEPAIALSEKIQGSERAQLIFQQLAPKKHPPEQYHKWISVLKHFLWRNILQISLWSFDEANVV